MKKKIIEVRNLNFSYDSVKTLEEVNFSIYEGEFVALFGPNGGGKTTLLNLLMGFLTAGVQTISILGVQARKMQSQMSYVPQHFDYDNGFPISVLDVVLGGSPISWFGTISRKERIKAHDLLEMVGLDKFIHRPFSDLSGGQQQRALIARALINDPALLFLDEPTSSIDPEAGKKIYDLLFSFKGKITMIMVTHLLQSVMGQADRLFCVQRTVQEKSKDEMCKHFAMGLYHP